MLFGLRAFRFLHTVLSKETFFFLYPTSFIHPISIPSSFSISPRSFLSLSPHSTFSIFFPLLPSNICFLSPRSHIKISPSFLFLLHSPFPGPLEFLLHTGFFDFLPSVLLICLCPFHSALHSSIFLLLLIFPLLHWQYFSLSFSVFFCFTLQLSVSILPFHSICSFHPQISLLFPKHIPLPYLLFSLSL
jgi:hypothetical protein